MILKYDKYGHPNHKGKGRLCNKQHGTSEQPLRKDKVGTRLHFVHQDERQWIKVVNVQNKAM